MPKKRIIGAVAAATSMLLAAPAGANAADKIYGLLDNNSIAKFTSDAPGKVTETIAVQGLQAGEQLVGIDVRPANDHLYVVGSTNRIYRVNPDTGATRAAFDPFSPALNATNNGVDFNPVADALRIVSDSEQNLRIPFTGGNAGNATNDAPLAYAAGDPGAGTNPNVAGAAYTNSVEGATSTQLFDIDTARDVLVRQDPPNAGTLVTVGPLGLNIEGVLGFDVSPQGNVAYAAMAPQGEVRPALYTINLTSGAATLAANPIVGVNGSLRGIAVATGAVPDDRTPPELSVAFSSTILEQNTDVLKPSVNCNEACKVTVNATVEGRAAGQGEGELQFAGQFIVDVPLDATARRRIARRGTELIRLEIIATDAAGNRTVQNNRRSRTQTPQQRRGF